MSPCTILQGWVGMLCAPVRHPPGHLHSRIGHTEGRLGGGARPMSGRVGLASAGARKRSSRACALVVCKRGTCGHLQCCPFPVRQCRSELKLLEWVAYVQAMLASRNKAFKMFDVVEARCASRHLRFFCRSRQVPCRAGSSAIEALQEAAYFSPGF